MIKNLTQHPPSAGQDSVTGVDAAAIVLLHFAVLPSADDIIERAEALAALAAGHSHAMVGGAPYLMGPLVAALQSAGITPLFAFTERRSVEETLTDGTVRKVSIFAHVGWVEAC